MSTFSMTVLIPLLAALPRRVDSLGAFVLEIIIGPIAWFRHLLKPGGGGPKYEGNAVVRKWTPGNDAGKIHVTPTKQRVP